MKTIEREAERVEAIYRLRATDEINARYLYTESATYMTVQEKERAMVRWIRTCGILPVSNKTVLEIGCGGGANLLWFLRAGFLPENLVGNELLLDRAAMARRYLPAATELHASDALQLDLPPNQFHVVFQSLVFSSILDEKLQVDLAARMWGWAMPGGGVLWYDFIYNNPRNPDVMGIPLKRIRKLFSGGSMRYWRLTLAPPVSRAVTQVHPSLYTLFNMFPVLRTHVLCWIQKS